MATSRGAALAVLLLASVHEFVWGLFPVDLQGDVRQVTQWPLVVGLAALAGIATSDRFVWAVGVAVSFMSATSAICSLSWMMAPWPLEPGAEQCSAHWGVPVLLVSGLAALLVISGWRDG